MRIIFSLLILTLAAAPAQSQDHWRQVNGPYGGTIVSGMTMTPEGLFASTVGGLFRSNDAGATWELDTDGVTVSGIDTRALIRLSDRSSLLATYGGGIYKRAFGSDTWVQANSPDGWVRDLVEAEDGTIYAATIRGILRSDDGGTSWRAMSVADRSLNIRMVATQGSLVFAATSEGVYKSDDRGFTWDWASAGMTTFDTDLLFVASNGDLYSGTSPITGGCTLFRTRSSGRFWTCVQPQKDPIRAGGMAEDEQGRLYFGGYRFVYSSDDEGSTWKPVATTTTTVHGIAASGSNVIAGTYGRGVIRSGDRGGTWQVANDGLQSAISDMAVGPDGDLYVSTLGGVYASPDRGSSWELLDDLDSPVRPSQSLAFDREGRLLDGTLNGLFRLDRRNETWDALGPPGTPPIHDIVPGPDGEIYVGYHAGIFHLRGQNWTSYPLIGPDQASRDVIAVGLDTSGTLFAGGAYDSFMRPFGTEGWIRLSSQAASYFEAQVFAHGPDGKMYAGTRYFGVMRSSDFGQSWTPMTEGLSGSDDIRTIVLDENGTLHIGSFGNGIYQLDPITKVWHPLNSGMEKARRVTSLAFDEMGNAYAGTFGSGVWIHEAGSTASEPENGLPNNASLSVFPNPSSGASFAQVTVPVSGEARVEVFDVLGRRVGAVHAFLEAGNSTRLPLSTERFTPGLYSVRVSTGQTSLSGMLIVVR
ncbi:MAG: ligand-binding sensor domain-containing protein [Rhodothermales bacterium]|jgi:ligand-binding sensor domain-containing protein